MRATIVLALTSACIPEPTGLAQSWPPALGLSVEAVTTGDLDGDGQPEVLVYSTGDEHRAGIYAIEGHDDLALGTATPVQKFTTYVPLPFTKPIAGAQGFASDGTPRVFTSYIDTFNDIVVETLSNQYGEGGAYSTDLPIGNTLLWPRPVRFPGTMMRVVVSNGSMIEQTADDGTDALVLPSPSGATWSTASVAMTYTTGSDAWTIVVATPSEVWRAPIPMGAQQFAWQQVRSGTAWAGQTALDLDGDGRDDIVGLDLTTHAACAVDAMKASSACVPLGSTSPGTEISIVVAHVAGATAAPDLVIAQATATETTISVVADFTFTGDTFTGTTMAMPPVSVAHGRAVVVNAGVGTPEAVLLFAANGNAFCAVGGC